MGLTPKGKMQEATLYYQRPKKAGTYLGSADLTVSQSGAFSWNACFDFVTEIEA
jgi:hypothetical protein